MAIFASCRALDQVRNTICYPRLNVKIVATHGGITVGEDGATHQAIEDISIMRAIPNMTVIIPCDAVETKKAIRAVVEYIGPAYVRLGRDAVPLVTTMDTPFTIGKAVVMKEGNDLALCATGIMVGAALEAARQLEGGGISARVVNFHTVKPIDEEMIIRTAKEAKAIISLEENTIIGGLGGALAEVISREALGPLIRIGIRDTFAESGKPAELLAKYGLSVEHVIEVARKTLDQ
jgi:transketolase